MVGRTSDDNNCFWCPSLLLHKGHLSLIRFWCLSLKRRQTMLTPWNIHGVHTGHCGDPCELNGIHYLMLMKFWNLRNTLSYVVIWHWQRLWNGNVTMCSRGKEDTTEENLYVIGCMLWRTFNVIRHETSWKANKMIAGYK